MTYSDKLKDPRWQKKRLEILQRDNFTCRICKDIDSTLHVHHITYNGNPFDADENDLITLCDKCHKTEHDLHQIMIDDLLQFIKQKQFTWLDIERLTSLLIYIDIDQIETLKFCLAHPTSKNMLIKIGNEAKRIYP